MVALLLAHGAEVNIYYAAQTGDLAKLKTLINDNPALVFNKDIFGATPLFLAVQAGHKKAAELLLANKADVNAGDGNVDTPLDVAAARGYKDLVELLVASNADVNARDKEGRTPLFYAEKERHEDVAEFLRQHGGNEFVHKVDDAARAGDLEKVKTLLKSDPGLVFSKGDDGGTPLNYAAYGGHKDVAEFLLATKANVNAVNYSVMTPLHSAAMNGNKDMTELLLANKADVNARDSSNETPLHLAVIKEHKDVADLLRQHGGHE
jgi:ankyrin repeat protein